MQNIVIPMAWEWARFKGSSAKELLAKFDVKWLDEVPKPYLSINGKSMIEIALDTLNISWKVILIVNSDHLTDGRVSSIIDKLEDHHNAIILEDDSELKGAATAAIVAKRYINNNKNLTIVNSDQFFRETFSSSFTEHIKKSRTDWTILTYDNKELKNSFAVLDLNWKVSSIIEKPDLYIEWSEATSWVYHWSRWEDFIRGTESMVSSGKMIWWEFYIAPVYNENIDNDNLSFDTLKSNDVILVWTPKDLVEYLEN